MPINSFLYPGAKVTPAYEVANSCRFNDDDSPRLLIANPTAGTRTKGTFSTWFKRCTLGANQYLFSTWNNSTSGYSSAMILLQSDDRLSISNYVASGASGSSTLITERVFRDVSAWYHVCVNWDTTESETDRYKIYVNGTRETVFNGTPAYPTSSQDLFFNAGGTSNPQHIGFESVGSDTKYFDGYLAETVHIEGNDLAADQFGEFDEDSPQIWKPIDVSGLTFGDEGFYLDYEDSGDLGDDESGNGNDFAETNLAAVDQATDTPTNSFCTFNSIATTNSVGDDLTFSEGNCKITNTSDGAWHPAIGNMGATNGKWYAEFKVSTIGGASKYGIIDVTQYLDNVNFASTGRAYSYEYYSGDAYNNGNYDADYGDSFTTDDIISVAMDLDNMKLYFAKNGTWQDSGDPTSGATGTGTHAYFGGGSNSANAAGVDTYAFAANIHNSSVTEANFGNPSYANSSSNADGNGYGDFEYAVPSGYYALCTKNLAEYG